MCLNIKYIPTRSKFISPYYHERYLMPFKCGKCAECLAEMHSEWYYRIFAEWQSCLERGDYVLFQTLTYSNEFLPYISEMVDYAIPKQLDYSCFCFDDVQGWKKRLLTHLERKGYDVRCDKDSDYPGIRFFIAAEYGTSDEYNYKGTIRKATHRPHYHVLLFIPASVPPEVVTNQIAEDWWFGRVDRLRKTGEHSNYFPASSQTTRLAVSNYVAKYVQKVSLFQKQIDTRVDKIMRYIFEIKFLRCYVDRTIYAHGGSIFMNDLPFDSNLAESVKFVFDDESYRSWCRSESGKKYKRDLLRTINQFHRQSQGFGLSALRDVDISQLMNDGFLLMPDKDKIIRKIPLPKYYERKLFEEQILVDGRKFWQPTTLGLQYREKKRERLHKYLTNRYASLMEQYNYHPDGVSPEALACYSLFYKGYIKNATFFSLAPLKERIEAGNLVYNYVTSCDKLQFHQALVSPEYHGMSGQYDSDCLSGIPVGQFISQYTYHDTDVDGCAGFDKVLDELSSLQLKDNRARQRAFNLKQSLKNKWRMRIKQHI